MDNVEFINIQKKLRMTDSMAADVMGIRLQTVKNWASGVWEIPHMAEKFLRVLQDIDRLCERDYEGHKRDYWCNSYKEYEIGHDTGFDVGYGRGSKEGYDVGYDKGYSRGRIEGIIFGTSKTYDMMKDK